MVLARATITVRSPVANCVAPSFEEVVEIIGPIGREPIEKVVFASFDEQWRWRGNVVVETGTVDHVVVPTRQLVHAALRHEAHYAIMAHNHPSGDPNPSEDDLRFTRRFARTLDGVSVILVDHLVVTADQITSMRALGYL